MPNYVRWRKPGAMFFFTVVTHHRRRILTSDASRAILRQALIYVNAQLPFDMPACVLQPDHLHCLWALPPGDEDFSERWRRIKERFTRAFLANGGCDQAVTRQQRQQGRRGVWQPRFWEHRIRDEDDFHRHCDYIHYNPVKHGLAACPHVWPYSTFNDWVGRRMYSPTWLCACGGTKPEPPQFDGLDDTAME